MVDPFTELASPSVSDYALCTLHYALSVAILIVADVHANLAAFGSVLAQAQSEAGVDAIWCLGDLVRYGPETSACISLLRRYPHLMVAGNHDLAAAGVLGMEDFNPVAAEAARWTAEQLAEEDQAFIRGLPLTLEQGEFTLVHGSLRDPVWDYLMSESLAATHLSRQPTAYGLVGHSHFPLLYYEGGQELALEDAASIDLNASRFVANPGGLGQPRDGDPRSPYALLDLDARRLTFRRAAYDIEATQAKILAAGLPSFLADRLALGR